MNRLLAPIAIVAFVVLLAMAYCQGKSSGSADVRHTARVDSATRQDSVVRVIHDTVVQIERRKARTDTLVQVHSDTQLVIRETPAAPPETVTVRAPIVTRIATCDSTVDLLKLENMAVTASRDLWKRTAQTPPPRRHWGLGGTAGYGPQLEHDGALRLGWGAKLGITWSW